MRYIHSKTGKAYSAVAEDAVEVHSITAGAVWACNAYDEKTLRVKPVFIDEGRYVILSYPALMTTKHVIYLAEYLCDDETTPRTWIRKASEFHGKTELAGEVVPRFAEVEKPSLATIIKELIDSNMLVEVQLDGNYEVAFDDDPEPTAGFTASDLYDMWKARKA